MTANEELEEDRNYGKVPQRPLKQRGIDMPSDESIRDMNGPYYCANTLCRFYAFTVYDEVCTFCKQTNQVRDTTTYTDIVKKVSDSRIEYQKHIDEIAGRTYKGVMPE